MDNIKVYNNTITNQKFSLDNNEIDNGRFLYKAMEQVTNKNQKNIEFLDSSFLVNNMQMNFHFYIYSDFIINFKNLTGKDKNILINGNNSDITRASFVCFYDNIDNERIFQIYLKTKKSKKIRNILKDYESEKYLIERIMLIGEDISFKVDFKKEYLDSIEDNEYKSLDSLIHYILKDMLINIDGEFIPFMEFIKNYLYSISKEITDEKEIKKYLIKENFK
ncbi:hypothetical protein CPT_Machias_121 [Staphylococcus phage Machias]|nr:hypothetical protein CPT_Machias_121 [Staphylococcus phage Machias]